MIMIWKSNNQVIEVYINPVHKDECGIIIALDYNDTGIDATSWIGKDEALSLAKAIVEYYGREKDDKRK